MADTPANKTGSDKIQATIVELFDKLWNQRVTTTDAEVQRMYTCWSPFTTIATTCLQRQLACQFDATNDPTGMGRAWAIGLIYGQRPKFLTL